MTLQVRMKGNQFQTVSYIEDDLLICVPKVHSITSIDTWLDPDSQHQYSVLKFLFLSLCFILMEIQEGWYQLQAYIPSNSRSKEDQFFLVTVLELILIIANQINYIQTTDALDESQRDRVTQGKTRMLIPGRIRVTGQETIKDVNTRGI